MNDQIATFSMSIAAFISAYLMSLAMIPHIIIWVKERNLMDDPNDRSSHIVPTPSMGGLSFVGTIMIFILLIPMNLELFAILIGSVILMAMGFIDDLNDLSAKIKFLGQITVASLVFISGVGLEDLQGLLGIYELPYGLAYLLTVIVIVAVVNAFNLIDGIDGLAGGIGLLNCIGFGLIFLYQGDFPSAILALTFGGSLLGFLRYNFSPARIFMGDTGSLVLGLFMVSFFLKCMSIGTSLMMSSGLALILFPALDMTRLFVTRLLKGRSPFKADRYHFHHLLLKTGFDHRQSAITYYIAQMLLFLLSLGIGSVLESGPALLTVFAFGILFYSIVEFRYYILAAVREKKLNQIAQDHLNINALYQSIWK